MRITKTLDLSNFRWGICDSNFQLATVKETVTTTITAGFLWWKTIKTETTVSTVQIYKCLWAQPTPWLDPSVGWFRVDDDSRVEGIDWLLRRQKLNLLVNGMGDTNED